MKFYGVDNQGVVLIQVVSTLPSHNGAVDEGRIIYVDDVDRLYFGTASTWIPWLKRGDDFLVNQVFT